MIDIEKLQCYNNVTKRFLYVTRRQKMKTRTYTKMMAAAVLASSLLLGACGKKEESATSASSSKTVQASSGSKAASSSKVSASPKVSNSASSEGAVSQPDKPKLLPVSNSLLSKLLKSNNRSHSKLQVDKTLRVKQLNQPKLPKAIASFRISRQPAMLAIKVS